VSRRALMESDWRDIRDRASVAEAFTRVYTQYLFGKPRMSGARAALDYFKVPRRREAVAECAHAVELAAGLTRTRARPSRRPEVTGPRTSGS
jgi:beta-phosphoglucomutase